MKLEIVFIITLTTLAIAFCYDSTHKLNTNNLATKYLLQDKCDSGYIADICNKLN